MGKFHSYYFHTCSFSYNENLYMFDLIQEGIHIKCYVNLYMPYSCHVELIPLPYVYQSPSIFLPLWCHATDNCQMNKYDILNLESNSMCMTSCIKKICTNFHCTKMISYENDNVWSFPTPSNIYVLKLLVYQDELLNSQKHYL